MGMGFYGSNTPDKLPNILTYRSPFYIIIYSCYKLLKMVRFWPTLYLLVIITGGQLPANKHAHCDSIHWLTNGRYISRHGQMFKYDH